jgi:uridylate kinase
LTKEHLIISLGGSVVQSDDIDQTFFHEFNEFIHSLTKEWKIFLVIGGGKTARTYINLGRKQGFSETDLDWLGILATRINATFLQKLLLPQQTKIPVTIEEALDCHESIVIMGGTNPGHSTDYVGANLASKTHAKMYIIATNVAGVYDKDPNKYPNAKLLVEVSIDTLLKQHGNHWDAAGKNTIIDGPALQHIKNHEIPTYVVDGRQITEMINIINNKPFIGTIIKK